MKELPLPLTIKWEIDVFVLCRISKLCARLRSRIEYSRAGLNPIDYL